LAIEYDGWYWHKSKAKKDHAKQLELEKSGIRLLRVRELPLPKISDQDILVAGGTYLVKSDVDQLVSLLGIKREASASYLKYDAFLNEDLYNEYLSYFPSPLPHQSLSELTPNLSTQWHPTKNQPLQPTNFTARSSYKAWWICGFGHEYQASIRNRFDGSGCPKCSGRIATLETCMEATHPELARLWHPTKNGPFTPQNIKAGSGKRAWWQCSEGHDWQASPANMKKPNRRSYCPQCYKRAISQKVDNCMAETHHNMARALHPTKNEPFTAYNLKAGSSRTLWWVCSNDPKHEWQAIGSNQKKSLWPDLCPKCTTYARWRKMKEG
jgi:hypothetical protein